MAVKHGKGGAVKVATAEVAKIQDWSFDQEIGTADATGMGEDWESHLTGVKKWSGSLNALHNSGDSTGQAALTLGAEVALNMYSEGDASGSEYHSGTATITKVGRSVSRGDNVSVAYTFMGQGALVTATVS